jgi:dUTPase
MNHGIETKTGTIDRDYTGILQVMLQNNSEVSCTDPKGSRIVCMVVYRIAQPIVKEVECLNDTQHQDGGFGITGITNPLIHYMSKTNAYAYRTSLCKMGTIYSTRMCV